MKKFVFPTMVAVKISKRQFFSHHSNVSYKEKELHQRIGSYTFKVPLKKLGRLDQCKVRKYITTLKM